MMEAALKIDEAFSFTYGKFIHEDGDMLTDKDRSQPPVIYEQSENGEIKIICCFRPSIPFENSEPHIRIKGEMSFFIRSKNGNKPTNEELLEIVRFCRSILLDKTNEYLSRFSTPQIYSDIDNYSIEDIIRLLPTN